MTNDRLLTERQRQQKYLDRLPENFDFPLFNARRALESQRASGYRTSAAASREIVDNAIEAGAGEIHVVFENALYDGKKSVTAVAFVDNGPGMLANMARYALIWGGGTHYDDPAFIGKFGFGLPNASINQTRKTEVYTRMNGDEPFTKATLDIDTFAEFGTQSIPKPVQSELPVFIQTYIALNNLDLSHGTVVVWVNPDRLSGKKTATLSTSPTHRRHPLPSHRACYSIVAGSSLFETTRTPSFPFLPAPPVRTDLPHRLSRRNLFLESA